MLIRNFGSLQANFHPNLDSGHVPQNKDMFEQVVYNKMNLLGVTSRVETNLLHPALVADKVQFLFWLNCSPILSPYVHLRRRSGAKKTFQHNIVIKTVFQNVKELDSPTNKTQTGSKADSQPEKPALVIFCQENLPLNSCCISARISRCPSTPAYRPPVSTAAPLPPALSALSA